jgi:hypothetical protein
MTHRSLGFLAASAAFALFGGLQLEIASGRALEKLTPGDARLQTGTTIVAADINRATKSDRDEITLSPAEGRTIIFQHPELPSTTVAVRLWETVGIAKNRPFTKDRKAPADKARQTVACEGVVSALTEVAKQLEVGRCVT